MDNRYNISEVARMLNVSGELLRHYERKGLTHPTRGENGYRQYTYADLIVLTSVRRMKNMGFTLEQAEELIYGVSHEDACRLYEERCGELEREMELMRLKLESVKELTSEIRLMKEMEGVFLRTDSPHALWLPTYGDDSETAMEADFSWGDKMPAVWISPFCTLSEYMNNEDKIHFGYSVSPDLANKLCLSRPGNVLELKSRPSVCVNINTKGTDYLSAKRIRSFTEGYLEKEGLILKGDVWGLTIGSYVEDGQRIRCHKIYLPVKL